MRKLSPGARSGAVHDTRALRARFDDAGAVTLPTTPRSLDSCCALSINRGNDSITDCCNYRGSPSSSDEVRTAVSNPYATQLIVYLGSVIRTFS